MLACEGRSISLVVCFIIKDTKILTHTVTKCLSHDILNFSSTTHAYKLLRNMTTTSWNTYTESVTPFNDLNTSIQVIKLNHHPPH